MCLIEKVDCARKYVLVGNPVVSLDNISVFAIEERQELIAKNQVRFLYTLILLHFFIGQCHGGHFYKLQFSFYLTMGMQNDKSFSQHEVLIYACACDGLISGNQNHLCLYILGLQVTSSFSKIQN